MTCRDSVTNSHLNRLLCVTTSSLAPFSWSIKAKTIIISIHLSKNVKMGDKDVFAFGWNKIRRDKQEREKERARECEKGIKVFFRGTDPLFFLRNGKCKKRRNCIVQRESLFLAPQNCVPGCLSRIYIWFLWEAYWAFHFIQIMRSRDSISRIHRRNHE